MAKSLLGAAPFVLLIGHFSVGCGGSAPPPESVAAVERGDGGSSRVVPKAEKEEAFVPSSGGGDAPMPFVREERSSRLDVARPKGRAKEKWRVEVAGARREPCKGPCALADRAFVLTAGNRVAVADATAWELFDSRGRRVEGGKVEHGAVRLDRASGLVVSDDARPPDIPVDARAAMHEGGLVTVANGAIHVGEQAIEGRFDAFDGAIDESGVACVVVRQAKDLFLWTIPFRGGAIGRLKIPGPARRALGPPVLGRRLRVFVLDTGLVAVGLDDKRLWERRGLLPTGGVTVTADDEVLVADGGRLLAIDSRGRVDEIYEDKHVVFVTPPVLSSSGVLFVASSDRLHAFTFT